MLLLIIKISGLLSGMVFSVYTGSAVHILYLLVRYVDEHELFSVTNKSSFNYVSSSLPSLPPMLLLLFLLNRNIFSVFCFKGTQNCAH